jgi:AMMECR1 domain-containing protein
VKKLNVGVSFLVNFEKDKQALEWEVGKHGIVIDANINS